jgi:CRISPR-associated protein Cmr2
MRYELFTTYRMPVAKDKDATSVSEVEKFISEPQKEQGITPPQHVNLLVQAKYQTETSYTRSNAQKETTVKFTPKSFAQVGDKVKVAGLKRHIHGKGNLFNPFINSTIESELNPLRLNEPQINMDWLPTGSFWLKLDFQLATPYFSKDDTPFYIIDNPLKKEKVFQIPLIPASSWKGNLRWTAMFTRLVLEKDNLTNVMFTQERLWQTLLFGTEQGFDETKTSGFAAYLDSLKPEAKELYNKALRELLDTEQALGQSGQLHFFTTYLNKIDMMVINPHDAKTRVGKIPVYYEVAPVGAKGVFHLLYIPRLLSPKSRLLSDSYNTLASLIPCVSSMFLTYGFSAKKTMGMGQANSHTIKGFLRVAGVIFDKSKVAPRASQAEAKPLPKKGARITTLSDLGAFNFSETSDKEISQSLQDVSNTIKYEGFNDLLTKLEQNKDNFSITDIMQ